MTRLEPEFVEAMLKDNRDNTNLGIQKFEEAAEEWDNVANIEPNFDPGLNTEGRHEAEGKLNNSLPHPLATPLTRIEVVLKHLEGAWLDPYLLQVREGSQTRRGLSARLRACLPWAPPPLPVTLRQGVRRCMATALVQLDNDCPVQIGMLYTIYRQLTGARFDPPRYGSHWEDIGFQGTDPATDLRGVGLLGLVQVLHLVMTPELLPLGRAIHTLSRDPTQEFPFLVLSINISRICLHALRDGLLDRLIREEESVWSVANTFYVAVLHHVFTRWKNEHLTITKSGFVLQEAEATARKNPGLVVRRLELGLTQDYSIQSKQSAREQVERDSKPVVLTSS